MPRPLVVSRTKPRGVDGAAGEREDLDFRVAFCAMVSVIVGSLQHVNSRCICSVRANGRGVTRHEMLALEMRMLQVSQLLARLVEGGLDVRLGLAFCQYTTAKSGMPGDP